MSRHKTVIGNYRRCMGCRRDLKMCPENFGPHKTGVGGYQPRCRKCMAASSRMHHKLRKEEIARIRALNAPPLKPGQICDHCFDLSHRRPLSGCPRCKLEFAPLAPVELVLYRNYERAV